MVVLLNVAEDLKSIVHIIILKHFLIFITNLKGDLMSSIITQEEIQRLGEMDVTNSVQKEYKYLAEIATYKDYLDNELHPVQDYFDGKMHYGISNENKFQIISLKDNIINISDLPFKTKIKVRPDIIRYPFPNSLISKNINELVIDPFRIFNAIKEYLETYIFLSEEIHYYLLTLWIMGTYIYKSFPAYPYIHLSAERGSGKTTTLNVLESLCFNGLKLSSFTKPILYRKVNDSLCTLLIDEAETLSKDNGRDQNGILEILRDGYNCTAKTGLMDDDNKTTLVLSLYCPKIFASINAIDDVLRDRTITLPMIRPVRGELKNSFNPKDPNILNKQANFRAHLYLFGLKFAGEIQKEYKNIYNSPVYEDIVNRQYELWAPLLAIALVIENYSKGLEISDPLLNFARIMISENENRDESENIVIGVALELYRVIVGESKLGIRDRCDQKIISTESLYQHLKEKDLIEKGKDKIWLTKLLKQRNLASNVSSGGLRYYYINENNLKAFVIRYNLTEVMRINNDNKIWNF